VDGYGYVGGNPVGFFDPEGLKSNYWSKVNDRWSQTNMAIPGFMLPVGAGFVTSGYVANAVGGMTFGQAIGYWGTYEGAAAIYVGITECW
ncbi:MAG: hypothetical protein GY770_07105, partial [Aestuariibacter sp.]|nr:hypothetical protein [Aestuariibacter sp.]